MSNGKAVGIGILIVMGIIVLSWALGWLSLPFELTSKGNVKKQWAFAYEHEESLNAAARKVCSAQKALDTSETIEENQQRRSHLIALEQNYASIQAKYDAQLRNAFEAKYIKPSDVPERAPELTDVLAKVCKEN